MKKGERKKIRDDLADKLISRLMELDKWALSEQMKIIKKIYSFYKKKGYIIRKYYDQAKEIINEIQFYLDEKNIK